VLRSSTETKSSLRTTELIAYVATVLAIIMTALAIDADGPGGTDPFGAETALRYITYLTLGYMVARGLAKAGSWRTDGRDITDEQADAHDGAHDPRPEAEPEKDATGEDRPTPTSHPRANGTSTGEPGASDASDSGASGADAPAAADPAADDAPSGARSS